MPIAFVALGLAAALTFAALAAWPLLRTSPRLFAGVVATIPVLAFALYQIVGTPAALDPAARAAPQTATAGPHVSPESFAEAIAQLRAELQRDPAQPEGWALLARSYAAQGDFANARDSYAKAVELSPEQPVLLVEAAQARAQADPRNRFDDEAIALLERAVSIQPENQRGRWFLGVSQRQRGLHAEAAATWESLLPQVDASTAASLRTQIDEARSAAGLPPLPAAPAAGTTSATTTANAIVVRVELHPDLAARVRLRGDASVFVIARVPNGPPMPVAVEKRTLRELPLDVVLDDGDSPMPTQKLSALKEVEVIARLSASGEAMRQVDDIESAPARVALPAKSPVELVIGSPP